MANLAFGVAGQKKVHADLKDLSDRDERLGIREELASARIEAAPDFRPLLDDADPVVVGLALERLGTEWKPEALDRVVGLLRDDDETLRWKAMMLIADHGEPSLEARLPALLGDPDLRASGMALYIAARVSGEKALPVLRAALKSDAELLRYDALSALLMHGGAAGKTIVREYMASGEEPSPLIRERIEGALREP